MVGYDNINDNNFRLLVDSVANKLIDKLSNNGFCEFSHFLNAYNCYQEEERDGADYIFDIDNTNDVIVLLEDGFSIRDIACDADIAKYRIIENHEKLKRIGVLSLFDYIKIYMRDIVTCAFLYGQVEEYKVLFEKEIEPLIVSL